MEVFRLAQDNPDLLDQSNILHVEVDVNKNVEIQPRQAPINGQRYSIEELIELMARYSDNYGYEILNSLIGPNGLKKVYDQLNVPFPEFVDSENDYTNVLQTALFFRSLFNATYISREYSEKALALLSQSDFREGIAAGIPKNVRLANKFGIATEKDGETIKERQLHDCGIVYKDDNPYLLCIMTRGNSKLEQQETAIAHISEKIYQHAY